MVFQSS